MTNPVCPYCGLSNWEEGPKFNGHKSYCKQHPESRKGKAPETPSPPKSSTPKPSTTPSPSTGPAPGASTSSTLQPVTFTFSEGERLPSQQEIPEFKTPEQEKAEARKGEPETVKATLAEERKAGVSAIGALIMPLMEMWNRTIEGGSAFPNDPKTMAFTKDDAEMVAQAVILVDAKYGGPLSKSVGGEFGPEIFLLGVSMGMGIKMYMGLRLMQARRKASHPKSAAPSSEEIPRERTPLEKVGDSLSKLVNPKKPEKEEEEKKPEGTLSEEDFMKVATEYQKNAIGP